MHHPLPIGLALALTLLLAAPVCAQTEALASPRLSCPGNPDALGTARTITVGIAAPVAVGLKTYPRSLDLADHEVALTFDDGPLPATTPRVLAALEHECVRATFFLIGRDAAAAPAIVRREIADGDTVAHHTWSHPAVTERGLPDAAARADIEHGFEADDRAAYGASAGAPRVPFFRFPGFADTPALLSWLDGRHVAVFGADLWASDWVKQTPDAELALLMGRLDRAGRGIILLHDIKAQTAAMLPALLRALKSGGYRVVALVPGPGSTAFRPAPSSWSSETEKTVEATVRTPEERKRTPNVVGGRPFILPAPADTLATPPVMPQAEPAPDPESTPGDDAPPGPAPAP